MVHKYRHLYQKVYSTFGYTWEKCKLPNWIHLTITTDTENDLKYLTVHSKICIDKESVIQPCYSTSFSDEQIIKDLSGHITGRFL